MYRSMQNIQHDVKSTCNDERQRLTMNGEIPSVPITTLAGISSLTDLLPEMPLPSPFPHTLSNKSLLFHPRVAEEANNLLNLRDDNLVPLLANSLLQTTSDHIELKDNYSSTDQLIDRQPELLTAIVQKNPTVFKNVSATQRTWQIQRQSQQPQQMQPKQQANFQQHKKMPLQMLPAQQLPQKMHNLSTQKNAEDQSHSKQTTCNSQPNLQKTSQCMVHHSVQSPQQSIQSQQYHPQIRQLQLQTQQMQQGQHMQSMQQHGHSGVLSMDISPLSSSASSRNFTSKIPSTVLVSAFNTSPDNVNTMNSYQGGVSTSRPMQVNQQNRLRNNYPEMNATYQHHNFISHQTVTSSSNPQPFNHENTNPTVGGYAFSNVIQNTSIGMSQSLVSIPTPTSTPSATPTTQSPTRFMQRASVIRSDNNQQNGMFPMSVVDKFLIEDDINLNISKQSMVSDLNPTVLLQSDMMEQLPSIIDPSTNELLEIPPQLQSQIESHLQLNGQSHLSSQMNSHEMYPADMLENTVGSSICGTGNLLLNNVSSSIPLITGDLFMTPPLSTSVPHIDSVPQLQGISPQNSYNILGNVTPILDSEQDELFNKLQEQRKQPVIKLNRLTDLELKQGIVSESLTAPNRRTVHQNNEMIFEIAESKRNSYFRNRERLQHKDDYKDTTLDKSIGRKRNSRFQDILNKDKWHAPKPKLKKIERKLVPVLDKLSIEELMETNTYQKFNQSIEKVFEDVDDIDLSVDVESDDEVSEETLIQKYQLSELCSEAAKLKALGYMESIPTDRLIRLLGILEKNIRSGIKVSPITDDNDDEYECKLWLETAMERISRAVDASLIALYILTSSGMHKKVYLEDVIDRIILFAKYQLHNTIYPTYDPVYRTKQKKDPSSSRKKQSKQREVRDKSLISLYTKLVEVVSLLSELLSIQPLTDNLILHLSTMAVAPFFVEGINELQLNALKLVTSIFMKYEKHRKLLFDDILASMARLPNSKQSLRSYRLSSQDYIQILTALVLQLIQCMVVLPKDASAKRSAWDPDSEISRKFKGASTTASSFLVVFLNKCSSKSEEIDYRPLFENFVQDLLITVNKPEWPVSELMLSVLGKLLVAKFVNKNVEISLRVASLDYLGVIAARLRKDSVTSHLKLSTINSIISDIRAEEMKDEDNSAKYEQLDIENNEQRTQFLQRVLLDYLAVKSNNDESLLCARHFYISQWYHDALTENNPTSVKANKANKPKKKHKRKTDTSDESVDTDEELEEEEEEKVILKNVDEALEAPKQFFLSKINPFEVQGAYSSRPTTDIMHTYIDYESAELVSRYLASKRPFSKSFETYLKHIIQVLMESSVQIRTKAMKCLIMIVEADPGILALKEMQMGVCHSFLDHSTSVREAAVDLVGKFVLSQPTLLDKYYEMLSARILDTGVSVRKRVIKILKDICIEYPNYPKIPEICVKIIRRVNDENGIRKLVIEVFQNMWFTPMCEKDSSGNCPLQQKVMHITDVVSACKGMGLEWFEQLLLSLFKPKEDKDDSTKVVTEPPKTLVNACKQIVDCLVNNIITLDGRGGNAPQRLVACVTTLFLFAKIRPQLLVQHAITLQPYLSLKCQTPGDYQVISCVARILEMVVPMLEHASETFLSMLEEDAVKLIFQHDQTVILSCISCLGSVVNNVTRNFTLIRDCFLKYFSPLQKLKNLLENGTNPSVLKEPAVQIDLRRSMYIVGLMLRFFDFKNKEIKGGKLLDNICDEVFATLTYFMHIGESSLFALRSVGSVCIRHYDYMLGPELMAHYQMLLRSEDTPTQMKVQVLNNLKFYLQEEEKRMIKQDEEWATLCKNEDLKEMGDVSSGMASTIIQLYLKDVLESFLHLKNGVRQAALGVIQLILSQGLVHPVQIVPYLICMSTDDDKGISACADKQLQDIEKKYPGFIHMKAQTGIKLSFKLQKIIQGMEVTRGFRVKESELPTALNGFLYSILRGKQQRRALIMSILKQFEENVFQKTNLAHLLYLADNVAYFPYQVLDEPLFIIHQINIIISVTGTYLLQSFKESLLPNLNAKSEQHVSVNVDEDEEEDEQMLLNRIPENVSPLRECITASQGCLILLVLKQHLKSLYGFTDSKIASYSPSESAKIYEKSLSRKNNSKFHPKAAFQKLRTNFEDGTNLSKVARRELISEYLEFKQLIISLDREDEDDDDDEKKSLPSKSNNVYSGPIAIQAGVEFHVIESEGNPAASSSDSQFSSHVNNSCTPNYAQSTLPRIPKLMIVAPKPPELSRHSHSHGHRSHKSKKSDRHKKHHHKRKKKLCKSDESDNAYSDPDYSV